MKSNDYRKIYEKYYGTIPVDYEGRTYDIHHKDGNRDNNDPSNLIALSIQEHYQVHLDQEDYGAALWIMTRLSASPEELSEMAKKAARKQIEEGKNKFVGEQGSANAKEWQSLLLRSGRHHFQSSDWQAWANKKKASEGRLPAQISAKNGTHPWLGVGSAKGRVWVTDGTVNKLVYPNQVPEGFIRGRMKKRRKANVGKKKSTT